LKLDRLENVGFRQKVPNHEDRRSVLIRLTETGSQTILASLDDYLEALRNLQASLTNRQKADLANALKILLMELET
jgi:DNA-binding MarR family transcriptional regulator